MPEFGRRPVSREYLSALARHWWWVVVGVIGGLSWLADNAAHTLGYVLVYPSWISMAVCALGVAVAQFLAFHEMRLQRDEAKDQLQAMQARQSRSVSDGEFRAAVEYSGTLSDVHVLGGTLQRFAVAEDVSITNRDRQLPLCVSAQLTIQWGNSMRWQVAETYDSPITGWDLVLAAFSLTPKRQLVFPLNLHPAETVRGHIVFCIPVEGIGVNAMDPSIIDPDEFKEGPRQRECRICFTDTSSDATHEVRVGTVYAPSLGGPGTAYITDLAVAGGGPTFTLPSDHDERADSLHIANTQLQNRIADLERQLAGPRLAQEQISAISRSAQAGLAAFWTKYYPAEADETKERFVVRLGSVGDTPETLALREDFASALQLAGFGVATEIWSAGAPQYQGLVGHVTVLTGDAGNLIRPIVIEAMRAGRIGFQESAEPKHNLYHPILGYEPSVKSVATILIGLRR